MRRIGFSVALLLVLPLGQAAASWPPALLYESDFSVGYPFAIDGDGELFTLSTGSNGEYYIHKYTANGVLVTTLLTGAGGSFRVPGALAVDAGGHVYLADTYASRIQIFDNDLVPLTTWRHEGWIDYPRDIKIGADGRVYVKTLTEVQILSSTGEPLHRWLAPGGVFAIEPSGNILTVEQTKFHRYDPSGMPLADLPANHFFENPISLLAYEHVLLIGAETSPVMAFDETGVYRGALDRGGYLYKGPNGEIYVSGLTHYAAPGDILPPPPPPPPPPVGSSAVMLHISSVKPLDIACSDGPHSTSEIVTEAESRQDGTAQYFVYVLAAPRSDLDGLRGVQLGIEHTGSTSAPTPLRITDWHACSDIEWPDETWPNSGGGNTLTWVNCHFERILSVGTFSVTAYAPSTMAIAGYPATGLVKTADCNAAEEVTSRTVGFDRVGWVSMGGAARGLDRNGCNPAIESCVAQQVPTRSTTWGKVKSLYGNH